MTAPVFSGPRRPASSNNIHTAEGGEAERGGAMSIQHTAYDIPLQCSGVGRSSGRIGNLHCIAALVVYSGRVQGTGSGTDMKDTFQLHNPLMPQRWLAGKVACLFLNAASNVTVCVPGIAASIQSGERERRRSRAAGMEGRRNVQSITIHLVNMLISIYPAAFSVYHTTNLAHITCHSSPEPAI